MKIIKVSFLVLSFLIAGISALNAQDVLKIKSIEPVTAKSTSEDSDLTEIGYCGYDVEATAGLGAIYTQVYVQFPRAYLSKLVGSNLTKVMVYFGNTTAKTATLRLSNTRASTPFYTQTVSVTPNAWNEVTLNTPYVIENKEIYVGYSITPLANDEYVIGLDGRSINQSPSWIYIAGDGWLQFTSNLSLYGIVEVVPGDNTVNYDVEVLSVKLPITQISPDEDFTLNVDVNNKGVKTITSIGLEYQIGEETPVQETITGLNIVRLGNFSIDGIKTSNEGGFPFRVAITSINDNSDEDDSNNEMTSAIYVSSETSDTPTFVGTDPSNKNIVIEEYTGVNCTWCPAGHKIANQVMETYPGRALVVNIHQGSYAIRYTTQWGNALANNNVGIREYPAGTVNRHVFTGTTTSVSYTAWPTYAAQIQAQASPVNMAIKTELNRETRVMVVSVEAYYTGNSNVPTNMLNIAILQDSVMGSQIGSDKYPEMVINGLYQHNHMLRDLITGQWGYEISETTTGSFYTQTFVYRFPQQIGDVPVNLDKMEVVGFIAESKQEILTGVKSEMIRTGEETSIGNPANKATLDAYIHNNLLYISSESPVKEVKIFDISGRMIQSASDFDSPLSVENLNSGAYIIKVNTAESAKSVKVLKR